MVQGYENSFAARFKRSLNSIVSQNYRNYKIVYIDNGSSDDSYTKVRMYRDNLSEAMKGRFRLVQNVKRTSKIMNLRESLFYCDDNDIMVLVDGSS